MFNVGLSGIRDYGPGALAFSVIILLAGVLIERRMVDARPAAERSAHAQIAADEPLPGLRRIVLDPCTGLETSQSHARTAKAD